MKIALLCVLAGLLGQVRPPAWFIVGTIVDASTGRPVAGASVAIRSGQFGTSRTTLRTNTDQSGRFLFQNLEGAYELEASANHYLATDRAIRVTVREALNVGRIALTPYRQIAGQIVDDRGEPLRGVTVSAFAAAPRRETQPILQAATDDQGRYIIDRVPPGQYHVCAVSTAVSISRRVPPGFGHGRIGEAPLVAVEGGFIQQSLQMQRQPSALALDVIQGRPILAPTSCYPAGLEIASAGVVQIDDADRSGVDLSVTRRKTVRVSGRVVPLPGQSFEDMEIRLVPAAVDEFVAEIHLDAALTETDGAGNFSFVGVLPGSYVIRAERQRSGSERDGYDFVSASVEVGEMGVSGLVIPMQPGLSVSGRLSLSQRASSASAARLPVELDAAKVRPDGWPIPRARAVTDATGGFEFTGLLPGVYRLSVQVPSGQGVTDLIVDGRSLGGNMFALRDSTSLVVAVSDGLPTLVVSSDDEAPGPVESRELWIFPANPSTWPDSWSNRLMFRSVPFDPSQTPIAGMPPGRYLVAVVDQAKGRHWWSEAEVRRLASAATAVHLTLGAAASVRLKSRR